MRTSPPVARGRTLAPPWLTAPPPPTRGGGGNSRVITQQHRQSTPQPERTPSPFLPASPLSWRRQRKARSGAGLHPPPPRLPFNRGRRPVRQDGCHFHSPLPSSCPLPRLAPSWASIVQGGAHAAAPPAVSRQIFLALYGRCIASGLRSRIVFQHQAGSHEVSISCRLSAPPTDASASAVERLCRRRHKRAPTASATGPTLPPPKPAPPPPLHDPPSPAGIASLPAKWTRKAARLSCCVRLTLMTN